jgi:hypothetical protein
MYARAEPAAFEPGRAAHFGAGLVVTPEAYRDAPSGMPVAVWVEHEEDLESLVAAEAVKAILTPVPAIAAAAGAKGVLVPTTIDPQPGARPVAPAVRAHIRRARGLPARAIAVIDDGAGPSWCGAPLAADAVDTALACAAVVVVHGNALVRAMAWGAPIVTDRATVAPLAVVPGRDVVVDDDSHRAAEALLDDEPRAAALSWSARSCYETHFDRQRAVLDVCRRLELLPTGLDRVPALLDELQTPSDAPAVSRAYARLAPFVR